MEEKQMKGFITTVVKHNTENLHEMVKSELQATHMTQMPCSWSWRHPL
jgi:hypothetical protein